MKIVFTLSTGGADADLINPIDLADGAPYASSKGAVNIAIAKYKAEYKNEGILFMAISPGFVNTDGAVPSKRLEPGSMTVMTSDVS